MFLNMREQSENKKQTKRAWQVEEAEKSNSYNGVK